jgi:hypothetical protein
MVAQKFIRSIFFPVENEIFQKFTKSIAHGGENCLKFTKSKSSTGGVLKIRRI